MYIGIDLGGTNIAAGLVDSDGHIVVKSSVPTQKEREWQEIIKDMAELAKHIATKKGYSISDIKAVGIGSPGTIDSERGMVVYSNNIVMHNVPMAEELQKYLNIPVNIENDANAAAYGEYMASGGNANSFVFMTLGTGVGGGIIINGQIYRGFNGAGAEIGHTVIELDGKSCTCGRKGCLEAYASATALVEQTKEIMNIYPDSIMNAVVEQEGGINGKTAFSCAAMGDKAAKLVTDKYIQYVAEGITNIVNIFQPELFVIGGGISKEGDNLLIPIRELVYENDYNKYRPKTEIRIASLYNDAGIVGAAMAAKNKI